MSTAVAFTPDLTISWLRNDPDMQTRDAFAETKVVTLNQDFIAMGSYFPGSTQLLLKLIDSPTNLFEGAVYILDQQNVPGYENHRWYNQQMMGRLEKLVHVGRGRTSYAEMLFSFDNPKEGEKLYGTRTDGFHFHHVRFNEFRATKSQVERFGEEWAKRQQKHRSQLWQVVHYIAPPTSDGTVNARHEANAGMNAQQRRWLDEEQQIAAGKATMVTARSKGFDYAPTLEQQLDAETASLIDNLLSEIPAIPAGRVHRSKGTIVALTRRSSERTTTEFYSQEAIHTVLDLLDSLHREQVAMAALRSRVAEQVAKRHAAVQAQSQAASDKVRQELALAV